MRQVPLVPIKPPEISKFRGINNVPFGNGNLKINIIIIWFFINTISLQNWYRIQSPKNQSYINNLPGDYLSNKEVRQPNGNPNTSHTTKNEKLLKERQVRQKHDMTKKSESYPSLKCFPHALEFSHKQPFSTIKQQIDLSEKDSHVLFWQMICIVASVQ